jgi:predicted transcriptional regulator of viral defense system
MEPRLRTEDVLTRLADEDIDAFTIGDLVDRFEVTPSVARGIASRMNAGRRAFRLKRGLYLLLPPEYRRRPGNLPAAKWYLAARYLAAPDPYFLAYYTAMEHHRMTQHPLTTVFVATRVQKRTNPVEVGPVRFRFVTLARRKFGFGHDPQQIERGKVVEVADLDRAFVDCADRPDLCGGIEEVVRGFARRHEDLTRDRLLRYLLELDQPVVTKRLGYLLEIVGHGDARLMRELERIAGRIGNYARLVPGGGQPLERSKRWELDVNVDPDQLMEAAAT